jgi:DNA mismatch endonuclease (patch repair protein)
MARIRSKDPQPELVVRRMLHALGYRYLLHYRRLPGTPDLAFPARRKVVFVHGCFRHGDGGVRVIYVHRVNDEVVPLVWCTPRPRA